MRPPRRRWWPLLAVVAAGGLASLPGAAPTAVARLEPPAEAGGVAPPPHVAATAATPLPRSQALRPARTPGPAPAEPLHLADARFGEVLVYRPSGPVRGVVLYVSGDGGWNLGVVDMARQLLAEGAAVVGIDFRAYRAALGRAGAGCRYAAADFESLAHEVERRLALPEYLTPTLVGYSSGATFVYAVLAQSPPGTWAGALSLGFCPDLELPASLCRSYALAYRRAGRAGLAEAARPGGPVLLEPAAGSETPWVALHGEADQVCALETARAFVAATGAARLVQLPQVGHGFSVQRRWLPQFLAAYRDLQPTTASAIPAGATPPSGTRAGGMPASPTSSPGLPAGVPLVVVPAAAVAHARLPRAFALVLSGDGGWAGLDRSLAARLAADGIPVVGIDSLRWFWRPRDPAAAAADVGRVIEHFADAWRRPEVLLIGYSFGADVLPFLHNRLPAATRARVRAVSLLAPGERASFEIHVRDWLPGRGTAGPAVAPEIARMQPTRVQCVAGADDAGGCAGAAGDHVAHLALPGGHHFDGDYAAVAERVLAHASPTS